MTTADIRDRIVAEARSRVNEPWVHQGRGVDGLDCAGLVTETARALGLSTFDVRDYERLPDGVQLLKLCDAEMQRIPVRDMQAGDAVVLQFNGIPHHIGILGDYPNGGLTLIHASNERKKVVEHRLAHFRDRICAAYRLPGVPA